MTAWTRISVFATCLAAVACVPATDPGAGRTAAAGEASLPAFAERDRVRGPDALFDPAERSRDFLRNNGATGAPMGERVCPRPKDLASDAEIGAAAQASIQAQAAGPVSTNAPRDFARLLNTSAFRYLMDRDAGRARRDVDLLRRHAEADAWIPSASSWSAASSAVQAMLPLLPAWQILRQTSAASDADHAAIDGWLARVDRFTEVHPGDDYVGTARGANRMMLGAMTGNDALYRSGVQGGYMAQLRAMRPDGSFPLETTRGRNALNTSTNNVRLMVYAAEIAASRGVDLYGVDVDGRSLHDAVGFVLDARADNALVDRYAAANESPPADAADFRPGAQLDPFEGSTSKGWAKLYVQRFPTSDAAARIRAIRSFEAWLQADNTGGYVSCWGSRFGSSRP
ncbi:alginate lyase family protein [uncultured Jannaschia sp.]|uniref:alginate lyase family protein n=1 Tax=uncultured Jannaschia sp. TaxID=293347 RepID=UPI00260B4741|nr:alginate lyase family protein [uncultured Jannaschia sp.]